MVRSTADVPWDMFPPKNFDASHFDWIEYMRQFPKEALTSGSARRNLTRFNPLLFALLYFRKHITDSDGNISFSDFHLESCYTALNWAKPVTELKQYRDAVVAPREAGKSTWWFLILPMWAAAHGHVKFIAAYSDTATQAQNHLRNFKRELETNALLNKDYTELGQLKRSTTTGAAISNNESMVQTASGFTFTANGMDGGTLGLKVENQRPDLLVLDDIEPPESSYSLNQMKKRLSTVQDVIFPLNLNARVVISGTVTMPGSIIHQLVETVTQPDSVPESWVAEENIKVHYCAPIVDEPDGSHRSIWAHKWSLEFLRSIQHTRSYAKNFANAPIGADGTYWTENSFTYTDDHEGSILTYMSIDPSVTGNKSSDYTGIAVISYIPPTEQNPMLNQMNPEGLKGKAVVRHASHIKMSPGPQMRAHILGILADYPETRKLLIETNQGGDTWKQIFHSMPLPVETVHQHVNKEVRAAQLLTDYDMHRVLHEGHLPDVESEMQSFPLGSNDDIIDAVGTLVEHFRKAEASSLKRLTTRKPQHTSTNY